MITLSKEEISVTEDQILGYDPCRVLIYSTDKLDAIADRIQKEKGELPLFDYEGEYNDKDWYDFYFDIDGKRVTSLYFQYGLGADYCDEIEIDEVTKQNAFEIICEYYGGFDEYQKICKEYYGGEDEE